MSSIRCICLLDIIIIMITFLFKWFHACILGHVTCSEDSRYRSIPPYCGCSCYIHSPKWANSLSTWGYCNTGVGCFKMKTLYASILRCNHNPLKVSLLVTTKKEKWNHPCTCTAEHGYKFGITLTSAQLVKYTFSVSDILDCDPSQG